MRFLSQMVALVGVVITPSCVNNASLPSGRLALGGAVSVPAADVRAAISAVQRWYTQDYHQLLRISDVKVISSAKIEVHTGPHEYFEVERVKGKWEMVNCVLYGPDSP
jgi:hypothetical protein